MFLNRHRLDLWVKASSGSFTGAGDIVGSALGWWGLRAYSGAMAGTKCIRIVRASDSTQQDFNTLASGSLDIVSIATFLNATTGKIVTIYDQSGNGRDVTQATDAARPAYASGPKLTISGAQQLASSATISQSQPFTVSFVANRTGNVGAGQEIIGTSDAACQFGYNVNNLIAIFCGSSVIASGNDNTIHAVQCVVNGASSNLYIDGIANSGNSGASFWNGNNVWLFGTSSPFTGDFYEVGLWAGAFTDPQLSAMNTNQHTFWGF